MARKRRSTPRRDALPPRAFQPAPAPVRRSPKPPSDLLAERRARAMRDLRDSIPDVVYVRPKGKIGRVAIPKALPDRAVIEPGQLSATPMKAEPLRDMPLTMERPQAPVCKARPTNSKGDGTSRPFVPYCDKKS